jgi:hypothetical protein
MAPDAGATSVWTSRFREGPCWLAASRRPRDGGSMGSRKGSSKASRT